jgi:hypothetical protein
MARIDPAASARWMARRARETASSLKAEYESGKRGDDSPTTPIFPTPKEQMEALGRLLGKGSGAAPVDAAAVADDASDAVVAGAADADQVAEAEVVAGALRTIDWQQVKSVTAERTGDAAKAMRTMAGQVDWSKAQPIAGQVSSALIAAVASGRLPLAGPLGPTVARALKDSGVSQRIGQSLVDQHAALPPDFRPSLEEQPTASEQP